MSEVSKIIIPEIKEINELLCNIKGNEDIVVQIKQKVESLSKKYISHIIFFTSSTFDSRKKLNYEEPLINIQYQENIYNQC